MGEAKIRELKRATMLRDARIILLELGNAGPSDRSQARERLIQGRTVKVP